MQERRKNEYSSLVNVIIFPTFLKTCTTFFKTVTLQDSNESSKYVQGEIIFFNDYTKSGHSMLVRK